MRPVPNDIVSTLIRCLPQILENVQIDSGNTRLINAVRLTKRIIPRLKKIENEKNTNLGWQLDFNASELKKCREAGHIRREFDNSKYLYRCNDVVYICDQCKNVHHVDMSD